ncbi:hypothetical protein BCR35DRAFT_349751 [Leucosporidium creatinivorum]|uniref:F-box domain-containing protein n=1 Tax=Leucosporidium creatinivorum TaxID=106004 RepID=A0A1Y2G1Q2_9BASI|nr:hypothetical protein BCR35DRAFT_349751 [Leucosporidium creatinivorum]
MLQLASRVSPPTSRAGAKPQPEQQQQQRSRGTSIAQQLPAEVLSRIFDFAAHDDVDEWEFGGELLGWDQNGGAAPLARVCQAWRGPATALLYASIAIGGQAEAEAFLSTMKERPDLRKLVLSAVVGVGELEEEQDGSVGQAEASLRVMDVLETLTDLKNLNIRPLHVAAAHRVASYLGRAPLRTLVLTGRIVLPIPSWTTGLFDYLSWPDVLDGLERLEVDWSQSISPFPYRPAPAVLPKLVLTHLSLRIELPDEIVHRVLRGVGSSLRVLRIYVERSRPLESTAQVLQSLTNLRHLHYISNLHLAELDSLTELPSSSPALLDLVLPHLSHLTSLTTSSTEISSSLFSVIPPSLHHLTIRSFNAHGLGYSPSLATDLRTRVDGLKELVWEDTMERWNEEDLEDLEEACEEKGVRFQFVEDSEASLAMVEAGAGAWRVETGSEDELETDEEEDHNNKCN